MLIQNNGTDTHFLYRRYHIPESLTKYVLTFTLLLTPRAGNILVDEVLHFVFSSLALKRKKKKNRLRVIPARLKPDPTSWTSTKSYVSFREGEIGSERERQETI